MGPMGLMGPGSPATLAVPATGLSSSAAITFPQAVATRMTLSSAQFNTAAASLTLNAYPAGADQPTITSPGSDHQCTAKDRMFHG